MRRAHLTYIALIGITLAAAGWFLFGRSSVPKYKGKPASYWFRELCLANNSDYLYRKAEEALHQMGTNAVPYLLEEAMNLEGDNASREVFYKVLDNFPASWPLPKFVSRNDTRGEALQMIREIKPPADLLLPPLLQALDGTNTLQHCQAIYILTCAGEGQESLVPYFARALGNTNLPDLPTRWDALRFLGQLGPKAAPAIPELTALLRSTDRTNLLCLGVADALGNIGSNAASAIPLLKESYEMETNWDRRISLAATLCRIDEQQTEAFGFLMDNLTNQQSDSSQVSGAAKRLGWVGKNAQAAIPALLEAANGTNVEAWRAFWTRWRKLAPPGI
jgi:ferritin